MGRRNRHLDPYAAADLLESTRACRLAATRALATAPIGSEGALAIQQVIVALDVLTKALTGERDRFWTRLHSVPKRQE